MSDTSIVGGIALKNARSDSRSCRSESLNTGLLSTITVSLVGQLIASNRAIGQAAPSTWMSISSSLRSTTGFSSASTALRKIWIGCCAWAGVPKARTRTPATDTANASVALRQGKYVDLIVPPCRLNAGLPDEPSREQPLAGHDGDVLLSV